MRPEDYSDSLSSLSAVKPRACVFLTIPSTVWRRWRGPFGSLRRREPPSPLSLPLLPLSNGMSLAAKGTSFRRNLPAIPIKPKWRWCHGAHCSLCTLSLLVRHYHKVLHGCASIRKRRRRRETEARLPAALLVAAVQRGELCWTLDCARPPRHQCSCVILPRPGDGPDLARSQSALPPTVDNCRNENNAIVTWGSIHEKLSNRSRRAILLTLGYFLTAPRNRLTGCRPLVFCFRPIVPVATFSIPSSIPSSLTS